MADLDQNTTNQDDVSTDVPAKDSMPVAEETQTEEVAAVEEEPADEKSTQVTVEEKLPPFRVGDTIRVFYKIIEGDKMRIQPFEGIVISFRGSDVSKTFTVRRIGADQVGVERIFQLHSPNIEKIKVMRRGNVRRAKLFYLRAKKGREAMRVREADK